MTRPGSTVTWVLLVAALCAWPASRAYAQVPTIDAELETLRQAYDYANYAQVLERAQARIDRGGLSARALVELHKYAGLAAFNLGRQEVAERHFSALLQLDPDYNLDPFAVAPPAIALFEELRQRLEPQLSVIRQQLRVEAERAQRDAEERARQQREEEERRRRFEELSRTLTVRTVERRSFLVNFVPFGAGQFQQGRTVAGVTLAAGQGALALTSLIAYLAYDGLIKPEAFTVDTVTGPVTLTRYGIPRNRVSEANTWRIVKYASAGAFYTLYTYGVVDAIYHHQDEVVTTTTVQLPQQMVPAQPRRSPREEEQPGPEQAPPKRDTVPLSPSVTGSAADLSLSPFFFPTPGGMGAGLHLQF